MQSRGYLAEHSAGDVLEAHAAAEPLGCSTAPRMAIHRRIQWRGARDGRRVETSALIPAINDGLRRSRARTRTAALGIRQVDSDTTTWRARRATRASRRWSEVARSPCTNTYGPELAIMTRDWYSLLCIPASPRRTVARGVVGGSLSCLAQSTQGDCTRGHCPACVHTGECPGGLSRGRW